MEDKQLLDYKIFVFDLDDTIVLHKVNRKYSLDYNKKIRKFLSYLKNQGKYLYIASHNREPDKVLDKNGISLSYFDGILGEPKMMYKSINTIEEYTNKKDMIIEILNRHKDLSKDDVVFFDDRMYNIKQVESINVKCILVDKYTGLFFFNYFL